MIKPAIESISPEIVARFISRHTSAIIPIDSFVYFITDGKFVKIGKSRNVINRIKEIQAYNSHQIRLLFTIPIPKVRKSNPHWSTSLSLETEAFLHRVFKDFRKHGEWFDIYEKLNFNKWRNYYGNITNIGKDSDRKYCEIIRNRSST